MESKLTYVLLVLVIISLLLNGVLLYALFQVRNIATREIDNVVEMVEGVKEQKITFDYPVDQETRYL
ncbi:hypothetical protein A3L08_06025 [Thermococcus pacificus]|uniref:Uncharacterized protein n=1 Tax=Thermococcus pacificus TaxID=71998 RepID=A0A218P800_9EURY|nr:hypothetical protein A3L08_06025 [Thermococcus pacificus]